MEEKQYGGSGPDGYFLRFKNELIQSDPIFDDESWWDTLVIKLEYEFGNEDPQEKSLLLTLLSFLIYWYFVTDDLLNTTDLVQNRNYVEYFNKNSVDIPYSVIEDDKSIGKYFDKGLMVLFISKLIDSIKSLEEYKKKREFLTVRGSSGRVSLSPDNFIEQLGSDWYLDEETGNWIETNAEIRDELAKDSHHRVSRANKDMVRADIWENPDYMNTIVGGPKRFLNRVGKHNIPYIIGDNEEIDPSGPKEIIKRLYERYNDDIFLFDENMYSRRSSPLHLHPKEGDTIIEMVMVLESFNEQIKLEMWGKLKNENGFHYENHIKSEIYDNGYRYGQSKHNGIGHLSDMISYMAHDRYSLQNPPVIVNNTPDRLINSSTSEYRRLGRNIGRVSELWDATTKFSFYTTKLIGLIDEKKRLEETLIDIIDKTEIYDVNSPWGKHNTHSMSIKRVNDEISEFEDKVYDLIICVSTIYYTIFKKYSELGYDNIEIDEEHRGFGDEFKNFTNDISMVIEIKYFSKYLIKIFDTDIYERVEKKSYVPEPQEPVRDDGRFWDDDSDDSSDDDDDDDDGGENQGDIFIPNDELDDFEGGMAKKLVTYEKIDFGVHPAKFKQMFARVKVLKDQLSPSPHRPPEVLLEHLYENHVFNPTTTEHYELLDNKDVQIIFTKLDRILKNEVKQKAILDQILLINEVEGENPQGDQEEANKKARLIISLFGNPNNPLQAGNPITDIYGVQKTLKILKQSEYLDALVSNVINISGIPKGIIRPLDIYSSDIGTEHEKIEGWMWDGSHEKCPPLSKDVKINCMGGDGMCDLPDKYIGIDESVYSVVWPERHEYLKNINDTKKVYPFSMDLDDLEEVIFNMIPSNTVLYDDQWRDSKIKEINMKIIKDFMKIQSFKTSLKPIVESELRRPLKKSPTRTGRRLIEQGVGVGDRNRMTWKINPKRKNDNEWWTASGRYMDVDEGYYEPLEKAKSLYSLSKQERERIKDQIDNMDDEPGGEQDQFLVKLLNDSIDNFDHNEDELLDQFFLKIDQLEDIFNSGNPDSQQRKINIVYTDENKNPILDADGKMVKTDVLDYISLKDDFVRGIRNAQDAASKVLPFLIGFNADEEPLFIMEEFATLNNQPKYTRKYFEDDQVSLMGAPENVRSFARKIRNEPNPDFEELGYDPDEVESFVTPRTPDLPQRNDGESYRDYYSRIGIQRGMDGGKKKKKTIRKNKKRNLTRRKNKLKRSINRKSINRKKRTNSRSKRKTTRKKRTKRKV